MTLKVLFWGNQDNIAYRAAKWIDGDGIETFVCGFDDDNIRSHPSLIDPDFQNDSERSYQTLKLGWVFEKIFRPRKYISIADHYDVVIVTGFLGVLSAWRLRTPIILMSIGPTNLGVSRTEVDAGRRLSIRWEVCRFFVRRTAAKSRRILVHYMPEIKDVKKLKFLEKTQLYFAAEDPFELQKIRDDPLLQDLTEKYQSFDKVYLWLSRCNYRNPNSPEYKGTDKYLLGIRKYMQSNPNHRCKLIVGDHGYDISQFKSLVVDSGMSELVDFVPHLTVSRLLSYLSLSNAVVFDELTEFHATSSGMFREALGIGSILVKSFDPEMLAAVYREAPPIYNASSIDDVCNVVSEINGLGEEDVRLKQISSIAWCDENISPKLYRQYLRNICFEIAYFNKI